MGYLILQCARFFETLIFSIGTHLTISVGGIFFFSFTVSYLLAAYVVAIAGEAGLSVGAGAALALAAALLIGVFFAALYRRLSADSFAVFMVASIFAFDALLRSWSSVTGGVLGIAGIERPAIARSLLALAVLEAVIAIALLIVEYVLLRSHFGRALIAHRENPRTLDSIGVSATSIGSTAIILASLLSGIAGMVGAWRIQYLDPTFGGITYFLFGITVAILAVRPKVSWLIGAAFVVLLLPELLRFTPLPTSMFAYLRQLIYAVAIIILVHRLSAAYTGSKRSI